MTGQSALIPVTETSPEQREPLHLRYFKLLRRNENFRRLWLALLVSEIGDWFYSLAVYDLLLELTHSGKAVSWAIIIQTLPWFFMTPLAGPIVDRLSRRRLMILADVARGFVVLGLLLPRSRAAVGSIYALLGLEVVFASLFNPASNALLPNMVSEEDLPGANALSSATWSMALTVGGALGGLATALLGRRVAFVVNSLSFFASAALLQHIRVEEPHLRALAQATKAKAGRSNLESLREGAIYLKENPKVPALILAKTGIGLLGGVLLLLVVFGERIFPIPGRGALAVGLLYAARGVGAALGPLIGDQLMRGRESSMWRSISVSFFLIGLSYLAFSRAPNLNIAALAVVCAHMSGSNIWVTTNSLLQLNTSDQFRGRVFALEAGMIMLAAAGSNYLLGMGLDNWNFTARQLAAGLGVVLFLPGLLWLPAQAAWAHESRKESAPGREQLATRE